jgi:hypothetical protein
MLKELNYPMKARKLFKSIGSISKEEFEKIMSYVSSRWEHGTPGHL